MVDKGLEALGLPSISRHCEVPEFKHACLGGVYAMESAVRFASADGGDRVAIAVAADIAEYALGSTGEQTQGAGATALLIESKPRLFEVQLKFSGSASDYRGPDFRKPHKRHFMKLEAYNRSSEHGKVADFPVFSGPYSTLVYQEEVTVAVEHMLQRLGQAPGKYYDDVTALFFHRPYNMMPIQAMSFLYARGLARATSAEHKQRFADLCAVAKVTPADVIAELDVDPKYFKQIESGVEPKDAFPNTGKVSRVLRKEKSFMELLENKMSIGSPTMANFGNLYTASLPCWLAAGFEEAYQKKLDIAGKPMVMVGYGSGDASMSIPIMPVKGWEEAASKIHVASALENPLNITKDQYESLHTGREKTDIAASHRKMEFVIERLGSRNEVAFQDVGIEYYKFLA
ncbi:hydroxymethylglutaryl-CoA synthase [Strigomonas culicis]|nr:hydroxymethylglutaryl-CoA synthase [Strigomonas culicis]|eukprot:EPY19079.1 hydroxymethylglutaryl-CoA synthase [Strigomonas culicis]